MAKTREELLVLFDEVVQESRALITAKNDDYGAPEDLFHNFRKHGRFGITVRLDDKICRLESFAKKKKLSVRDESVRDTVRDVINYAILYLGYE